MLILPISRPGLTLLALRLVSVMGAFLLASILRATDSSAVPAHLGVGATLDTLEVGRTVYHQVQIRAVNARMVMIGYDGGMASIRLRDLAPNLQAAFGYNPDADAAADAAQKNAQVRAETARPKPTATTPKKAVAAGTPFERVLQSFGHIPEIRPGGVDLRPKFAELSLNIKNQGIRPSCAVFAIVSALEYQNAQLTRQPDHFSEEYLIWATCQTLHRAPRVRPEFGELDLDKQDLSSIADEGFALEEVVTALRAYGIPLQERLPYNFGKTTALAEPPPEVVAEARSHRRVAVINLPGRDQSTRLANLINALNEGLPVAIGLLWPAGRLPRSGYLSSWQGGIAGGHAVTVVGYENKSGAVAETVFIFKNSWSPRWGTGGYGYATYAFLAQSLRDTALLDVELGESVTGVR